jgi:hypothetical protein
MVASASEAAETACFAEARSAKASPWQTVPAASQVGIVGTATPRCQASGSIRQGGLPSADVPFDDNLNS